MASVEQVDDAEALGPGCGGQPGVVSQDGDRVARIVQEQGGGQVDGVQGLQLPGESAGALNDIVIKVHKIDFAKNVMNQVDIGAGSSSKSEELDSKQRRGDEPSLPYRTPP